MRAPTIHPTPPTNPAIHHHARCPKIRFPTDTPRIAALGAVTKSLMRRLLVTLSILREIAGGLTRYARDETANRVYGSHRECKRPTSSVPEYLFNEAFFYPLTEPRIFVLEFSIALRAERTPGHAGFAGRIAEVDWVPAECLVSVSFSRVQRLCQSARDSPTGETAGPAATAAPAPTTNSASANHHPC